VTARPSERNDKGTGVKTERPHVHPRPKPPVHRVHPRDRHFASH
jgi:hypothetical protein